MELLPKLWSAERGEEMNAHTPTIKKLFRGAATFCGTFFVLFTVFAVASGRIENLDDKWVFIAWIMAFPPTIWVSADDFEEGKK